MVGKLSHLMKHRNFSPTMVCTTGCSVLPSHTLIRGSMKRLLRENVGLDGNLNTDVSKEQLCSIETHLTDILGVHLLR